MFFLDRCGEHRGCHSFPSRGSSELGAERAFQKEVSLNLLKRFTRSWGGGEGGGGGGGERGREGAG